MKHLLQTLSHLINLWRGMKWSPHQLFVKIKVKQECGLSHIVSGLPEEHWLKPSLCAIKELLENSKQHLKSNWPVLTSNELPESYP